MPPPELHEHGDSFLPAPEVFDWFKAAVVSKEGPIHNPEHSHLRYAKVGVLWTSVHESRGGKDLIGTCEVLSFRGRAVQKARQQIPFYQWFGPTFHNFDFLITLYAPFFAAADDYSYCAGVEHEFLHAGQAVEDDGKTKRWKRDGTPIFEIRPHDAEVFVSEWRRYGARASAGASMELAKYANTEPEVGRAEMSAACGTCLRLVA